MQSTLMFFHFCGLIEFLTNYATYPALTEVPGVRCFNLETRSTNTLRNIRMHYFFTCIMIIVSMSKTKPISKKFVCGLT